ncbi:MAG: K(+)-transporting ATPase subunit C [Pseudanabaenaceae cyanobacterium bins.68]|nr:K(+)-transporting ATPase subunit C [Pseudanabaenaceae cyanobacterium bins.68]
MNLFHEIIRAIRLTLILWVVVAVVYPGVILITGQVVFPYQANGSLIKNSQGQVIGSSLIGQPFTSDRYFHSRPSTINYSSINPQGDQAGILKTGISGASNLAPSNSALRDRIKLAVERLQAAGIEPTADLVYTSGSGLDPHISIKSARSQIARVAQTRQLPVAQLTSLVQAHTDERFLGIFGEPGVNVLRLNLALDRI